MEQKYIRTKDNEFIFFPSTIEHVRFIGFNPISAGFCEINGDVVKCWGDSYSLGIYSMEDDTIMATKQVLGIEKMIDLL